MDTDISKQGRCCDVCGEADIGVYELIFKKGERVIRFFLIRILHLKLSEKKLEGILQFFKFGIVGLSNTVISYIIYVIALQAFRTMEMSEKIDYLAAQVVAFILSVLWSFYWNNKYVFGDAGDNRNIVQKLLKTYVSYAFTGLLLNSLLAVLWVQMLGIDKMLAPIINLLVSVPVNFVMNKFWAFK